jgi:hypothetical protein
MPDPNPEVNLETKINPKPDPDFKKIISDPHHPQHCHRFCSITALNYALHTTTYSCQTCSTAAVDYTLHTTTAVTPGLSQL